MNLDIIGSLIAVLVPIVLFFFWILKSQFVSKNDFDTYKESAKKEIDKHKMFVETEIKTIANGHSEQNTKLALMDNNINHILESVKDIKTTAKENSDKLFGEIRHMSNNYKQLGENIMVMLTKVNKDN